MTSCSLSFIFVEFLSAWFLRQYRHFVDTSTYLIKVKAIFDRYTLADESGGDVDQKFGALNEMLAATLQWPETQTFTFGDTDFAKEAAATFPGVSKGHQERMSLERGSEGWEFEFSRVHHFKLFERTPGELSGFRYSALTPLR